MKNPPFNPQQVNDQLLVWLHLERVFVNFSVHAWIGNANKLRMRKSISDAT
jgi:hypothetical protein